MNTNKKSLKTADGDDLPFGNSPGRNRFCGPKTFEATPFQMVEAAVCNENGDLLPLLSSFLLSYFKGISDSRTILILN